MRVRLSARPFVRMEQLGSHRTDFHDMCYWSIFRQYVENVINLMKIGH